LTGTDILIEDGSISRVDVNVETDRDARVIDCSHHVVLPGFVNTHHHFYQTLTRNIPAVQNAKLFRWLKHLYEVWKFIDDEAVHVSSLLAMAELLKTGCTCTTDHHYLYPRSAGDYMAIQFAAADALGMRFSPTRGSMSLSKKDGGLPPDSVVQDEETILKDSERVITEFHDPSPAAMRKVALAPCSPFSVTEELMRETVALARENGVMLHTHLAETSDENEFCLRRFGIRPLELMERCDFLGNDVFYAHGIHFTDDELSRLLETGTRVAHCPSSNMRLGSGICRVREMLDLGITVSLAVDGSASNDSSDFLGEMRQALLLQRVRYGSDGITFDEVLKVATENGAKVLGFDSAGRIEPGYVGDIAVFDIDKLEYSGSRSDPAASLLFCGYNHGAAYVVCNGEIVVDSGRLPGIDEEKLKNDANRIAGEMLARS
jgi:cytosine/adenosine deaminase-related metal-dependent hydrolase